MSNTYPNIVSQCLGLLPKNVQFVHSSWCLYWCIYWWWLCLVVTGYFEETDNGLDDEDGPGNLVCKWYVPSVFFPPSSDVSGGGDAGHCWFPCLRPPVPGLLRRGCRRCQDGCSTTWRGWWVWPTRLGNNLRPEETETDLVLWQNTPADDDQEKDAEKKMMMRCRFNLWFLPLLLEIVWKIRETVYEKCVWSLKTLLVLNHLVDQALVRTFTDDSLLLLSHPGKQYSCYSSSLTGGKEEPGQREEKRQQHREEASLSILTQTQNQRTVQELS